MPDLLFILLLALVILGPKKLPQVAAQVGKYLAQFQRMRHEVMQQVTAELRHLDEGNNLQKIVDDNHQPEARAGTAVEAARPQQAGTEASPAQSRHNEDYLKALELC